MHDAGAVFRSQFRIAALDAVRSMPLIRVPGGGEAMTDRQMVARERVARAMTALGGFDSAAGSIVWHVVGLECSVREWAQRQGWGGRSVGHAQAQGMLSPHSACWRWCTAWRRGSVLPEPLTRHRGRRLPRR